MSQTPSRPGLSPRIRAIGAVLQRWRKNKDCAIRRTESESGGSLNEEERGPRPHKYLNFLCVCFLRGTSPPPCVGSKLKLPATRPQAWKSMYSTSG